MTDLVVIPFHDWRKVQREGGRTRDAHLITQLSEHPEVRTVIVLNRPVTLAEMLWRREGWKTRGEVISRHANSQLVRLSDKLYVIDFLERRLIRPAVFGKKWFFRSYANAQYFADTEEYFQQFGIQQFDCISFSVYAAELFKRLPARRRLFDAWDNFLRFPSNASMVPELNKAYRIYAGSATAWTTNSEENQSFYAKQFGVEARNVIKNGVNLARFRQPQAIPDDLARLRHPIVGMGLKVTHLLDTELLNRLTAGYPDVSFVLIGQILDKATFGKIINRPNFHYLGDKHYDAYSAYIQHFDVCLIPYHTGDRQHGGDAIKFYEYLAANKPVVSTRGNGVTAGYQAVWIADSHEEFCHSLGHALAAGLIKRDLPADITWEHKADTMLSALLHHTERSCQTPIKL